MPTLYRKTAKGLAEIETRAHRLAPRTRSALILVDGRRSDDDLRQMLQRGADDALAALLAGGFIEASGAAPAAAPRAAPSRPAPLLSLQDLRREAARLLTEQVGPLGDAVAIRIERSKTPEELRVAVGLAAQVLLNTRGRQAAESYAARFAGV
jgi:hypothetical protein